jgi:hypothetical protein
MEGEEGSSNRGNTNPEQQPRQSPVRSQTRDEGEEQQPDPRETAMLVKVADIVRATFEQYRKEEKDKGKGKATEEVSSRKAGFVTFKSFKSSGATEFEGVTDPVVAMLWVENTEKVFRISRVASEDKTVYASSMLTKHALTWWNNTYKALGEDERDNMPWEAFKARFMEKFCPKDMVRRLEKEFLEIKQNDMSVSEYETLFNEKAQFASKYIPTEEEKVERFVEGLRYEIKDFVNVRPISNFNDAVEFARKREHELNLRGALAPITKRTRSDVSEPVPSSKSRRFNPNFNRSRSQGASRAQSQSQSQVQSRPRAQSFSIQVFCCHTCFVNLVCVSN